MTSTNRARALLSGIVAGQICSIFSVVIQAFLGSGASSGHLAPGPTRGPLLLFLGVAMGVWAMWLYTALRPSYGPGIRTAVVVGLAWWMIAVLEGFKMGLLFVAPRVLIAAAAAGLPAVIFAALTGMWLYETQRGSGARRPAEAVDGHAGSMAH